MSVRTKKIVYSIFGALAVCIIVFSIINACQNEEFWKFNLFNGLTMLWTVGFSFIVTQAFSKYQRKTDVIVKVLVKLTESIDESKTCQITEQTPKETLLMHNREISNLLSILEKTANQCGISNDVDFLKKQFEEYESLIGNHIDDMQYLARSHLELQRPIKNMCTKVYEIMLKL